MWRLRAGWYIHLPDTPHSGSEESWFEPRRGNRVGPVADMVAGSLSFAGFGSSLGQAAATFQV